MDNDLADRITNPEWNARREELTAVMLTSIRTLLAHAGNTALHATFVEHDFIVYISRIHSEKSHGQTH